MEIEGFLEHTLHIAMIEVTLRQQNYWMAKQLSTFQWRPFSTDWL